MQQGFTDFRASGFKCTGLSCRLLFRFGSLGVKAELASSDAIRYWTAQVQEDARRSIPESSQTLARRPPKLSVGLHGLFWHEKSLVRWFPKLWPKCIF